MDPAALPHDVSYDFSASAIQSTQHALGTEQSHRTATNSA